MIQVLGVDENLERTTFAVGFDVVERHVDRMRALGPFKLVGRAVQHLAAWGQLDFQHRPPGLLLGCR